MTDAGAIVLLGANPNLETLNAAYCHRFSDAGARRLAEQGGALRKLNLTCTSVTSAGVRRVRQLPLAVLRVDQCEIEDDALHAATSGRLSVSGRAVHRGHRQPSPRARRPLPAAAPPRHLGPATDHRRRPRRGCARLPVAPAPGRDDARPSPTPGCAPSPPAAHRWSTSPSPPAARGPRPSSPSASAASSSATSTPTTPARPARGLARAAAASLTRGSARLRPAAPSCGTWVCSSGIGDTALLSLARSCPRLTHIDFSACPRVSDTGVLKRAELPGAERRVLGRVRGDGHQRRRCSRAARSCTTSSSPAQTRRRRRGESDREGRRNGLCTSTASYRVRVAQALPIVSGNEL